MTHTTERVAAIREAFDARAHLRWPPLPRAQLRGFGATRRATAPDTGVSLNIPAVVHGRVCR